MRMRGISLFLAFAATVVAYGQAAAFVPKKAEVVAAKEAPSMMSGGSLVSTALSLGLGAMNINNQFKALSAQCVPSDADINFVQRMVLEVAKTGVPSAEFTGGLGSQCDEYNTYSVVEKMRADGQKVDPCFEAISQNSTIPGMSLLNNNSKTLEGAVLEGFPKVEKASFQSTKGDQVNVSNIHEVFAKVMSYFGPDDLLEGEVTNAQKLVQLAETCSTTRLNAARQQAWMGFAQNAIMGIGTGTLQAEQGDMMGMIGAAGAMSGNGGLGSAVGILAPMLMMK